MYKLSNCCEISRIRKVKKIISHYFLQVKILRMFNISHLTTFVVYMQRPPTSLLYHNHYYHVGCCRQSNAYECCQSRLSFVNKEKQNPSSFYVSVGRETISLFVVSWHYLFYACEGQKQRHFKNVIRFSMHVNTM